MDANELLKMQHREVKRLYEEFQTASGATREELGKELLTNLTVHAEVEEELYYPELEKAAGRPLAEEFRAEHKAAKALIGRLSMMGVEDEAYEPTMQALMEDVMHHVEEEETRGMPEAETLGTDFLQKLGEEMEDRSDELKESALKRLWASIT